MKFTKTFLAIILFLFLAGLIIGVGVSTDAGAPMIGISILLTPLWAIGAIVEYIRYRNKKQKSVGAETDLRCKKCGTPAPNGVKFCTRCGYPIERTRNAKTAKNSKKSVFAWQTVSAVAFVVLIAFFVSIGKASADDQESHENEPVMTDLLVEIEETQNKDEDPEIETKREFVVGEDKSNPYVLTADELVDEINEDIKAAKKKYNGKWVQITGEITGTSTSGFGYGYYLYGQSTTTGYRGLRIMCWCDDLPYSKTKIGDKHTFIGQVLEITTVNATEIVDCKRVKES